MKVNYFKSTVRLNSFHNGLFDFLFTPECRLPGKRRDSLVDPRAIMALGGPNHLQLYILRQTAGESANSKAGWFKA